MIACGRVSGVLFPRPTFCRLPFAPPHARCSLEHRSHVSVHGNVGDVSPPAVSYKTSSDSTLFLSLNMKLTFSAAFLTALFAATASASVAPTRRDIFAPPITSPSTGTVWPVKTIQTVTWDTSNPPDPITDRNRSSIRLTKGGRQLPVVLADQFDILLGKIDVEVPWATEGDDYALILFGDSGNWGETFTITGGPN
ncbi:uncharacterized protein EV420DRAFT_1549544 [Desarmillaria tabescens]|uniref:Uncharacterized protein n=1 Tax=Armillaria tabescens TaxID=1929756 RepID=A0AA39KA67_ARMTA|nr:uncharacterized protein EV420DRAFT_1549544 [Desarmillaria tabescens]KAK0457242.1 hypothetical protein EV420DRAFT_1549544 [Desarmillaria tabescens]